MKVIVNETNGKFKTYKKVCDLRTIENHNMLILTTRHKQYFIAMKFVNSFEVLK